MNFDEIEYQERLAGRKSQPYRLDTKVSFVPSDLDDNMPTTRNNAVPAKRKATQQGGNAQKRQKAPQMQVVRSIRAPISRGALTRNVMPRSIASKQGLVLAHSEPISVAVMSALGVLSTNAFAIIPSIFPYLNGIASNFAKFKWLKLRVYYVPSCPTSTAGEIAMATYYDWIDNTAASTFIQTATMKNGVSFPPWGGSHDSGGENISIDIDCTEFDKPRYQFVAQSSFGSLSTSDKNNYAPVNLITATQGSAVAVPIAGRFWCKYTIQLLDPIASALNF